MAINREELLKLTKEEAIDFLLSVINDIVAVIKAQNERIAELEARLNQNSKNSSRPPSSDGFKKNPKSLRKPSGKKPGGQHGHEGSGLKLMHEPDANILHEPEWTFCPGAKQCKANTEVRETRYEIDITVVTNIMAHQIIQKQCRLT